MKELIFSCGLLLVGCTMTPEEVIKYAIDTRTGVCFAYISSPYGDSITSVDCEKVKDYLEASDEGTAN